MSAAASSSSASASAGRLSIDDPSTSSSPNNKPTNGITTTTTKSASASDDQDEDEEEGWAPISTMSEPEVRAELLRVREERDRFSTQYQSLLSKLTTMRATLGDRLRQDAEELDRREIQIESLSSKIDTLESTTSTLRSELLASHEETERLSVELDKLRKVIAKHSEEAREKRDSDSERDKGGRLERERELHELVERVKLDAHSWETSWLEERSKREELESKLAEAQHHLEIAQQNEAQQRAIAERESASAANLSAVLSEFQQTQESELARALGDYHAQVDSLSSSLAEYKHRAEHAERQLAETSSLATQAESLSAQVKEKNLLIGKLRHEAVILNEHLTEALRRLRNDQSEANVDKRLVTNLVIQFISTPKGDGKRWEMLRLIASVLDWGDRERELAGLQKAGSGGGVGSNKARISSSGNTGGGGGGDEESFSNLFVEFLLSEAERGTKKDGEESAPSTPGLPDRLFSPNRSTLGSSSEASGSPSKGDTPTMMNGDEDSSSTTSRSGRLGSYFGLSRGKK